MAWEGARAIALVAAGGAVGSVLRYALATALARPGFPWGTLAVNLVGCFAIGVAAGLLRGADARLLVAVGLLGGFTTMSAFALEMDGMLDENAWGKATLYVGATVAGGIALAHAGRLAARALSG